MRLVVIACLSLSLGCASSSPTPAQKTTTGAAQPTVKAEGEPSLATAKAEPPSAPSFEGLWRHPSDPRVGGFVSSPWTFSTTSYFIEGDQDLILVDTQFLPKDAIAFVEAAEKATGKTARIAIVLHANPDKFNGTAALTERGIVVVTSRDVAALIPAVHEKRVRAFGARYAPDYPTETPRPQTFAGDLARVSVPGATVELLATGAGCSDAHVLAVFDDDAGRHVFAGDLLANGSHLWLELGRTDQWLTRLDEIDALAPAHVYPGRGLPAGRALVDENRAYLRETIAVVGEGIARAPDVKSQVAHARDALTAAHPTLRFAVFLNIGLPAEIARQTSRQSGTTTTH